MSKTYYPLSAPDGNCNFPGRFYTTLDYEKRWIVFGNNQNLTAGVDYISVPFSDRRGLQKAYRWWLKKRKENKNAAHS